MVPVTSDRCLSTPAGRLAVIGDVGGHLETLRDALEDLGFDTVTGRLPADLTVVQVGDLVHRGPDSDAVVAFVDEVMKANGPRWVQLVGNHEAQYLFAPAFRWPETVSTATQATLCCWWEQGIMLAAASFCTAGVTVRQPGGRRAVIGAGGLLVTHAGLTLGCWDILGNPPTGQAAADAINGARFDATGPVWRPGQMLERRIVPYAGPVWAEPVGELYSPWLSAADGDELHGGCVSPGFHQVHGHASAYRWDSGRWGHSQAATLLAPVAHVDTVRRQVRVRAGDQVLWGIDPGHGRFPALRWSPLVLELVPAFA